MTRRRPALAAAALLSLALAGPSLGSWVVGGSGQLAVQAGTLGTPGALSAGDVTSTALTLTWSAPATGPQPDSYVVRRDGAVLAACDGTVVTRCSDSGLSPATAYRYTVVAVLKGWRGAAHAEVSATTAAAADTTAPTLLSLRRAGTSATTSASSVSWTATFSEPVTGVDVTDFRLEPGYPGAALTGVTGSGATWTVTASTGTGSGQLGLVLRDDDTIVDPAGNPLGGAGAGNGDVTGEVYTVSRARPSVTVEQKVGQADPVRTTPMLWTVRFSAPVTGFDATDVLRAGTTGGTVTVNGSGAEYEIALAGTPSDGTTTFTVPEGRAVDGAGNGNVASTSVDNAITYDTVSPTVTGRVTAVQGQKESFTGTTTEGSGTVQLVVTPVSGTGRYERPLTLTATSTGFSWSLETQPHDLAGGTSYTFRVVHTDAAGNVGTFQSGTFTGN